MSISSIEISVASIGDHSQAVRPECQHIVDLEELIKEEMRNLPPTTASCIYKIPQHLRDGNKKAYTPRLVAIGPYHANAEHLKSMEAYKLWNLKSLMSRSGGWSNLGNYVKVVEDRQSEARECYSGIEELDSQNFKRMLLLDGAFIVEFLDGAFIVEFLCGLFDCLLKGFSMQGNDKEVIEIGQDLLLLENQLPLFILEDLYDRMHEHSNYTFREIAYFTLAQRIPFVSIGDVYLSCEQVMKRTTQETVKHLLHLLRMCCLDVPTPGSLDAQGENPSDTPQTPPGSLSTSRIFQVEWGEQRFLCLRLELQSWWGRKEEQRKLLEKEKITPNSFRKPASVTELHEVRVKFRARKRQFMHIKFHEAKGVLEMPHLNLSDDTEIFFRNVIAYEQYYLKKFDFTNYMVFMAGLINTKKDVDILEESRLINNLLDSEDDAANIFNNITKYAGNNRPLVLSENKDFCLVLEAYTMNPWNKWNAKVHQWNAMLRRDYFGSPWAIISFLAAVVLLGLTAVQTIASVGSTKWH